MAPATRRMAERSGAVTLGPTWQYSRWSTLTADDVRRYLLQRTAHRRRIFTVARLACDGLAFHNLFAVLANPILRLRDLFCRLQPPSATIVEAQTLESSIDDFWNRASGSYKALCPRDFQFLNWRFVRCPQLEYRLFLARRDDKLVGYSVLRRTMSQELRHGCVVDIFAARGDMDAFRDLVRHAVEFFGSDVASVECATSRPEIASILSKAGFWRSRTLAPTVVTSDASLRERVRSLRDDWFFSKADHDWDQAHLG